MPNWCINKLKITEKVHGKIVNSKGEVTFNLLLPMPPSMKVTSPPNSAAVYTYLSDRGRMDETFIAALKEAAVFKKTYDTISAAAAYARRLWETDAEIEKLYQLGKTYVNNYMQYGYTDWDEWSCAVWGTKWDASDSRIDGDVIEFNTAWGPPTGWLNKLCELGVPWSLEWSEEGGTGGIIEFDGKTITKDESYYLDYDDEEDEEDEA